MNTQQPRLVLAPDIAAMLQERRSDDHKRIALDQILRQSYPHLAAGTKDLGVSLELGTGVWVAVTDRWPPAPCDANAPSPLCVLFETSSLPAVAAISIEGHKAMGLYTDLRKKQTAFQDAHMRLAHPQFLKLLGIVGVVSLVFALAFHSQQFKWAPLVAWAVFGITCWAALVTLSTRRVSTTHILVVTQDGVAEEMVDPEQPSGATTLSHILNAYRAEVGTIARECAKCAGSGRGEWVPAHTVTSITPGFYKEYPASDSTHAPLVHWVPDQQLTHHVPAGYKRCTCCAGRGKHTVRHTFVAVMWALRHYPAFAKSQLDAVREWRKRGSASEENTFIAYEAEP